MFQLSAFQRKEHTEQKIAVARIGVQAGDHVVIQKIINEQERIHKSFLTDDAFLKIQRYLGIMINRNMQGEYIEAQEKKENKKYTFAQDILKYISQYCGIKTTEDEVQYLSELLKNCRYLHDKNADMNIVKVQMVTRQFISEISDELEVNLNNDYDFFENLSNHISSMYRSSEEQFPENHTLTEIIEDNPRVLEAIKKVFIYYSSMTQEKSQIMN